MLSALQMSNGEAGESLRKVVRNEWSEKKEHEAVTLVEDWPVEAESSRVRAALVSAKAFLIWQGWGP